MEDPTETTDDLLGRLKSCTREHIIDLPEILRRRVDEATNASEIEDAVFEYINEVGVRKGWGFPAVNEEHESLLTDIADLAGLNDWPE